MAFLINGSNVISETKAYTGTANVSVTDSIIIANNDSLDSGDGYSLNSSLVISEGGFGFGDITLKDASIEVTGPPVFQGTVSGYTSGGGTPDGINVIDKFPFSSDGNASDVGDLTQSRRGAAGQSSSSSGYASGGRSPVDTVTTVDKFSFTSDGNATDVGDLTQGRYNSASQSSSTNGYTSGGFYRLNTIDKFPFAADSNASDVGDLTATRHGASGQSATDYGYTSGGYGSGLRIDKFAFATDGNATTVGNLTQSRYDLSGQSSTTSGYASGGTNTTPPSATRYNTIDKFAFASDANASDVGDLIETKTQTAGQSSTDSGYVSGGISPSTTYLNVIEKFPFSSDSNAADVGDLTQGRRGIPAGQQV